MKTLYFFFILISCAYTHACSLPSIAFIINLKQNIVGDIEINLNNRKVGIIDTKEHSSKNEVVFKELVMRLNDASLGSPNGKQTNIAFVAEGMIPFSTVVKLNTLIKDNGYSNFYIGAERYEVIECISP